MSANLSKEYGFVVSSSADWGLDLCTYPMSIMVTIILNSYGTMLFARYLGDNMNIRVPSHKLIFLENLKKRQFS